MHRHISYFLFHHNLARLLSHIQYLHKHAKNELKTLKYRTKVPQIFILSQVYLQDVKTKGVNRHRTE